MGGQDNALDRHQTFLSNLLDFNPKPQKSLQNRDFSSPFSIRAPGPRKQKGELVTSSQSFGDQLLSFLKIKKLNSFSRQDFSICKLDSHGSSFYLASQDPGGRHPSLIFRRRVLCRA